MRELDGAKSNRLHIVVVVVLFVAAMLQFALRGPYRPLSENRFNLCDISTLYSASRAWLLGENPYADGVLVRTWQASGIGAFAQDYAHWATIVTPSMFPLLTPLAALPPAFALPLFVVLSLATVMLSILAVLDMAGILRQNPRGLMVGSAALASAPIQTGIAAGQPALISGCLVILAVWALWRGRDYLSGVLLGLSLVLKVHLAAPFVLYALFFRRWHTAGVSLAVLLVFTLVGIAPLPSNWIEHWTANIALLSSEGRINDPTLTGPWRHHMIDLGIVLHGWIDNRTQVTALMLAIGSLLAAIYVIGLTVHSRSRQTDDHLLAIAVLGALTLLPVYHRLYDAVVMLPALAWAVKALSSPMRPWAIATLAAMSPLLLPIDLWWVISRRIEALLVLEQSRLFKALIEPHHALAVSVTSLLLLWAMTRRAVELLPTVQTRAQPPGTPVLPTR